VSGTLGCGQYEAYFKTRGGDTFVCRIINLTNVTWGRRLNEVSEASVSFTLKGSEGDCCECIAGINPWEHELSIYRDGEEIWCGPVVGGELDLGTGTVRFDARDLSVWFDKRFIEIPADDVEFEEVDITELYDWLISHAYSKEPWNMTWYFNTKLGIPLSRTYVGFTGTDRWGGNYQNIGQELRELTNSGIDHTVVRRVMLAGDLRDSTNVSGRITDKHWVTLPKIVIVGTSMATEVGVAGGGGGFYGWNDDQIWIERPYDQEREQFGLLQSFEAAASLDEEDTRNLPNPITQRAYNSRQVKKRPFEYIRGGDLASDAPVTFDQLIPGRYFRVDMTQSCRTIESNYLLTGLTVSFSADKEQVSLELVPPGAEELKGE
jgi:hypothetical protein